MCTGPIRGARLAAIARRTFEAVLMASSVIASFVNGRYTAFRSRFWCVASGEAASAWLAVIAIRGERSRNALATPSVMLTAPGAPLP